MPASNFRIPRWIWWLAAIALIVGIAAFGYVRWYAKPAQTPQTARRGGASSTAPVPVMAVPAKTSDVNIYLNGLGTVTPVNTVTVRSRVDGQLMRVLFKEGQIVKQGDVLAEIDSRPFQVQLTQAQGQMARDEALLANARIDADRYRKLLAEDSIAQQLVDTQDSLVRQYEGTVKVDQGQVDNARLQLTYARITAPITGRVGLRTVDAGNIIHSGDTNGIVVITQLQPINIIFTIPQDNLPAVLKRMQSGDRLPVVIFDRDQKTRLAGGTLITVDNQIDTTTGTVKLKSQVANEDNKLFPNQFVNARMLTDTLHGVTTVPNAAIQRGSQGIFVYVVKDDRTVTIRTVTLGPVEGEMTSIQAGIQPGELVVVDGADRLREGAKVELPSAEANTPRKGDNGPRAKGGGNRRKGGEKAGEQ